MWSIAYAILGPVKSYNLILSMMTDFFSSVTVTVLCVSGSDH